MTGGMSGCGRLWQRPRGPDTELEATTCRARGLKKELLVSVSVTFFLRFCGFDFGVPRWPKALGPFLEEALLPTAVRKLSGDGNDETDGILCRY